ncbi:MAG TPA: hypothetical protein VII19_08005 [Acidimicrobiales bacterium]|jgi:hypothetical protein
MTTAVAGQNVPMFVLYAASFVVVLWAVVDAARRPSALMPPGRKAVWIVGFVVGWFVFGLIGAFIAVVYLVGPRRRLNAGRM